MTAPSGSCVLYCGFSKIQSPEKYFEGSCFRRGIKLYASNHVYGVKEEILSETAPSEIVARCIPQMKSTCDYDVRLELSPNPRRIVRGRCSCKAGCRGWCKHAAAVAVFINSDEEKSCTELPRAWGKPSARPTMDTKKQIKELFASRPLPAPVLKPLCPKTMAPRAEAPHHKHDGPPHQNEEDRV
ncbi:uncharacterized protein LOC144174753 [Haemaphysalis longicornis]